MTQNEAAIEGFNELLLERVIELEDEKERLLEELDESRRALTQSRLNNDSRALQQARSRIIRKHQVAR